MVVRKSEQFESGLLINERYRVKSLLGRGGMGSVYLVEDVLENQRELALKTLRLEKMTESVVELFKGEFQLLAQLRHPNLAQVFEFGATPRTPMAEPELFFTIEFISGIDLFQATKAASFEDIFDVAVQMCRALEYMGTRGIVHGDLKPANILVENGTVRIVDFGIAPEFYKKSNPGLFGTPKYMAPELLRGDQVDRRADLYSLGVILYLLTARRAPFEGKTPEEFFRKHLEEKPAALHEIRKDTPIEFSRMVARLLAKDPGDRYFRAGQVIAAIASFSKKTFARETKETREGYILSGKLVGREHEMQQLVEFESNLAKEKPDHRMCMISAERGGGKTRMIKEWKNRLQVNQMPVFAADLRNSSMRPFFPMASLVDQILGELPSSRRRALQEKFPVLFQAFYPNTPEKSEKPVAPEGAQAYRVYEEASQFFGEIAFYFKSQSRQGLILLFDPLEALNQQDLDLLYHVVRGAQQGQEPAPILFVFTQIKSLAQRDAPGERTGFLTARFDTSQSTSKNNVVDVISHDEALLHIDLPNLSVDDVAQLVVSMVGEKLGGDRFVRDLEQFTNGNPLMIQEVLRTLAEQGVMSRGEDVRLEFLDIDLQKMHIPKTLGKVFEDHLGKLTKEERELLQALAVFQVPVSWEMLQRIFPEKSAKHIFQGLMSLRAKGELDATLLGGEVFYELASGGLRKALYESLNDTQRASLHLRFAQVLEREAMGMAERDELLARHFMLAGENQKASQYVLLAAKHATQKMAYASAVEFYQAALRLFGESKTAGVDERLFVYTEIARISRIQGDYQVSIETLNLVRKQIARKDLSLAKQIGVLQDLGYSYLLSGDFTAALREIDAAVALKPTEVKQKLRLMWIRGRILLKTNDLNEVLEGVRAGLEAAKGRAFDEERAEFFYNRGMVHYLRRKYATATQEFRKSLQIFERLSLYQRAMLAFNALGMVAFKELRFSQAIGHFKKSFSLATQLGDSIQMLICETNMGACYHREGKIVLAMDHYQRGLGISEKILHREYILLLLENLGNLYCECYHFEKAFNLFFKAFHLSQEIADVPHQTECLKFLAEISAARDDQEKAEEYYCKGLTLCEESGAQQSALVFLQGLTRIGVKKMNWKEAQQHFEKAEHLAESIGDAAILRDQCLLRARFLVRAYVSEKNGSNVSRKIEVKEVVQALKTAQKVMVLENRLRSLWEVLFWHGQFLEAQGKFDLAAEKYREARQIALKFSKTLPDEYRSFFQASAQFLELKEALEGGKVGGKGQGPAVDQTLNRLQAYEGEKALFSGAHLSTLFGLLSQIKNLDEESGRLWVARVLQLMAGVIQSRRHLLIVANGSASEVLASYCIGEEDLSFSPDVLDLARDCQGFLVLAENQRLYPVRARRRIEGFLLVDGIPPGAPEGIDGSLFAARMDTFLDVLAAGFLAVRAEA